MKLIITIILAIIFTSCSSKNNEEKDEKLLTDQVQVNNNISEPITNINAQNEQENLIEKIEQKANEFSYITSSNYSILDLCTNKNLTFKTRLDNTVKMLFASIEDAIPNAKSNALMVARELIEIAETEDDKNLAYNLAMNASRKLNLHVEALSNAVKIIERCESNLSEIAYYDALWMAGNMYQKRYNPQNEQELQKKTYECFKKAVDNAPSDGLREESLYMLILTCNNQKNIEELKKYAKEYLNNDNYKRYNANIQNFLSINQLTIDEL